MRHLWKVDDKDWVVERKEQWRLLSKTIREGCSAKSLKAHRQLFLTGEEPEPEAESGSSEQGGERDLVSS